MMGLVCSVTSTSMELSCSVSAHVPQYMLQRPKYEDVGVRISYPSSLLKSATSNDNVHYQQGALVCHMILHTCHNDQQEKRGVRLTLSASYTLTVPHCDSSGRHMHHWCVATALVTSKTHNGATLQKGERYYADSNNVQTGQVTHRPCNNIWLPLRKASSIVVD
jgi:hypothetical protein